MNGRVHAAGAAFECLLLATTRRPADRRSARRLRTGPALSRSRVLSRPFADCRPTLRCLTPPLGRQRDAECAPGGTLRCGTLRCGTSRGGGAPWPNCRSSTWRTSAASRSCCGRGTASGSRCRRIRAGVRPRCRSADRRPSGRPARARAPGRRKPRPRQAPGRQGMPRRLRRWSRSAGSRPAAARGGG